jgi:hypothetical protein
MEMIGWWCMSAAVGPRQVHVTGLQDKSYDSASCAVPHALAAMRHQHHRRQSCPLSTPKPFPDSQIGCFIPHMSMGIRNALLSLFPFVLGHSRTRLSGPGTPATALRQRASLWLKCLANECQSSVLHRKSTKCLARTAAIIMSVEVSIACSLPLSKLGNPWTHPVPMSVF